MIRQTRPWITGPKPLRHKIHKAGRHLLCIMTHHFASFLAEALGGIELAEQRQGHALLIAWHIGRRTAGEPTDDGMVGHHLHMLSQVALGTYYDSTKTKNDAAKTFVDAMETASE
jgi:hypothetical protein